MTLKKFYHYGKTKKEVFKKTRLFLEELLDKEVIKYSQIKIICAYDRNEPEDFLIGYKHRAFTEIEIKEQNNET